MMQSAARVKSVGPGACIRNPACGLLAHDGAVCQWQTSHEDQPEFM